MDTITSQLLSLVPFIGLGLVISLAYRAEGLRRRSPEARAGGATAEPADLAPPVGDGGGESVIGWIILVGLAVADTAAVVLGGLTAASGAVLRIAPEILEDVAVPGGPDPSAPGSSVPGAVPSPDLAASADVVSALLPLGAAAAGLGLLGLLLLAPPARRALGRLIPIDPDRVTHTVALHYALLLVFFAVAVAMFIPIIAADPEGRDLIVQGTESAGLLGIWMQNLGFALLGVLGVGLFVARGPRAVLERLGLTPRLHLRWWMGATLVALAASWGVDSLWSAVAPDSLSEVEKLSELLFEPIIAYGIAGALTIGLAAGIGEEIIFRGALQPRFGLGLTALLFTAIHTQYTVSLALVQILVVALLLGYARKHANTTTAIAIHSTYNFALAMSAVIAG